MSPVPSMQTDPASCQKRDEAGKLPGTVSEHPAPSLNNDTYWLVPFVTRAFRVAAFTERADWKKCLHDYFKGSSTPTSVTGVSYSASRTRLVHEVSLRWQTCILGDLQGHDTTACIRARDISDPEAFGNFVADFLASYDLGQEKNRLNPFDQISWDEMIWRYWSSLQVADISASNELSNQLKNPVDSAALEQFVLKKDKIRASGTTCLDDVMHFQDKKLVDKTEFAKLQTRNVADTLTALRHPSCFLPSAPLTGVNLAENSLEQCRTGLLGSAKAASDIEGLFVPKSPTKIPTQTFTWHISCTGKTDRHKPVIREEVATLNEQTIERSANLPSEPAGKRRNVKPRSKFFYQDPTRDPKSIGRQGEFEGFVKNRRLGEVCYMVSAIMTEKLRPGSTSDKSKTTGAKAVVEDVSPGRFFNPRQEGVFKGLDFGYKFDAKCLVKPAGNDLGQTHGWDVIEVQSGDPAKATTNSVEAESSRTNSAPVDDAEASRPELEKPEVFPESAVEDADAELEEDFGNVNERDDSALPWRKSTPAVPAATLVHSKSVMPVGNKAGKKGKPKTPATPRPLTPTPSDQPLASLAKPRYQLRLQTDIKRGHHALSFLSFSFLDVSSWMSGVSVSKVVAALVKNKAYSFVSGEWKMEDFDLPGRLPRVMIPVCSQTYEMTGKPCLVRQILVTYPSSISFAEWYTVNTQLALHEAVNAMCRQAGSSAAAESVSNWQKTGEVHLRIVSLTDVMDAIVRIFESRGVLFNLCIRMLSQMDCGVWEGGKCPVDSETVLNREDLLAYYEGLLTRYPSIRALIDPLNLESPDAREALMELADRKTVSIYSSNWTSSDDKGHPHCEVGPRSFVTQICRRILRATDCSREVLLSAATGFGWKSNLLYEFAVGAEAKFFVAPGFRTEDQRQMLNSIMQYEHSFLVSPNTVAE